MLVGSTDVGLWVPKQMRDLGDIIFLGQVKELVTVSTKDGQLEIGVGVSLNDVYAALGQHYPELREMWQHFASLLIRNAGTLGGNVVNGSPIGDSPSWLIALGAQRWFTWSGWTARDAVRVAVSGLYEKDMQPGEFVESVRVPVTRADMQFRTYKLAKRFDQDISAVCAVFSVVIDGAVIGAIRIAFGEMAATPKHATKAESVLLGNGWEETRLQAAMAILAEDFSPLSDMRASSAYLIKTAQNLLRLLAGNPP